MTADGLVTDNPPPGVVDPKAVGGRLPSVQEYVAGCQEYADVCHVKNGLEALRLGCSLDKFGEIRLTAKFIANLGYIDATNARQRL